MAPSIHDGDRILNDPLGPLLQGVQRGDIVVLKYPLDPSVDYIKRVIGLPGDEVVIEAGEVWVSEDSVSMLYEALSSGARVGVLAVRRGAANRITAAVDALVERGWLGRPGHWQPGAGPERPLNEAGRCAAWVRQRWLSAR
jgi:signal peptidase I